ncbi:cation-translocating P-type ATPase [Chromatocurvus halotolerans]|uniref:P-type E1-E2 ATPase n=1 Tax=Chromatocurvus halotolerans TaxID=1132028 RepID=A0A4R2KC03_9GAMM|nr:cation-transporting P-type ATPase [Chromatocurvus halotolerans]TCO71003.1 P-type E1-E2 ATPase [Chromatocurvus halotolerans]
MEKTKASWHAEDINAVMDALDAHPEGLSSDEAKRRLAETGPNSLPQPARHGFIVRFLRHFHNLLIYVLLASAVITALLGHWVDTVVILAVVVLNAVIGVIQEGKAERAMDAIRHMLAPKAAVLRDGKRTTVPGDQLVPGDMVLLDAGDKVPADMRLHSCRGMSIQEAILTGESVPVEKTTGSVAVDAPLGDRSGMAYSGTLVTTGAARGVVVATGAATEIGHISTMIAGVETLTTPLTRQMAIFSRWLTVFILTLAAVILAFGYLVQGQPFGDIFTAVVGLSVAAIPEGLPAVLTVTLAIGVQTMARRRAIVRRLPAIETLGSVSVICSDKTGTLTRNEMMVATACIGDAELAVEGEGYRPEGDIQVPGESQPEALKSLALVAALCNDAALHHRDDVWTVEGDPMEGALLAFAGKAGVTASVTKQEWVRSDSIPFDTRHRFMATLDHDHEHHVQIHVKGAPETLYDRCTHMRALDGSTLPFDRDHWHGRSEALASRGQRVLALASRSLEAGTTSLAMDDVEDGLVFEGLVGLIDPPRPEAIKAVAACHRASIDVKMITGDHAGTAAAIGAQIGLRHTDRVLTGAEIDALDDNALADAVRETDVFARTSPEHKLRLVTALQQLGYVVAMTGDGVNDAPALKRADAGIAMGRSGSEAAKEASELVLLDDNFSTIVGAVEAGRTVYDNLKKIIAFLLPVNGGESLSLLLAILLGLTLPITAAQILWVNMVSSVALAMALAFEPTEPDTLSRPPREPGAPILSRSLVLRIGLVSLMFCSGVFGIFWWATGQGLDEATARTMAVNTLVVMEIFYLFSVRYSYGTSLSLTGVKGTPAVWTALVIVTGLQLAFTYLPWLAVWFDARALNVAQGAQVLAVGVLMLLVMESGKWLQRRYALGGRGV